MCDPVGILSVCVFACRGRSRGEGTSSEGAGDRERVCLTLRASRVVSVDYF